MTPKARPDSDLGLTIGEITSILSERWILILSGTLITSLLSFGLSFLISPTFTARVSFLPPQQASGNGSSALASLGSLGALAGLSMGTGPKNSSEQLISLMQSVTVSDRLIQKFDLLKVYIVRLQADARKQLARRVAMTVGKKDGLISVEVEDIDPERAAAIANAYVEQLRLMTSMLSLTEARQRREFFERLLNQSRDQLAAAQQALQSSGFNQGALKAEPKAAAESYSRLRADLTIAELRLQGFRSSFTDISPEVRNQQTVVDILRNRVSRAEQANEVGSGSDFMTRYRDFKYQETLFELYARQFELARIDESKDSQFIQVVDPATPPETRSKPNRGAFAMGGGLAAMLILMGIAITHQTRKTHPQA